jgi:ABC-type nitrate/sulfonate/bicarbonate transport system substrate-binding protein
MPIALSKGAVDGAIMPEPIATAARARGVGVVVDPNPAPGVVITTVMLGKNLLAPGEAALANAVLRALRRAANELQSAQAIMSKENIQIWSKYTKIPADIVAKTIPYVFARDLALDVNNLLDQQKFLAESGRIQRQLPAERVIEERFVIRMK